MKATEKKIQEWVQKYGTGNVFELCAGKKFAYTYNPVTNLEKWKLAIRARRKSISDLVDFLLNNCWIDGDESFKTDDAAKLSIEDQVDQLIDVPECNTEILPNGNILITVEGHSIEVRKATRLDIRYAEDRNRENKPLNTQIFLLDKIAVDEKKLDEIRNLPKVYAAILFAVNEIKDAKDVIIKKF